MEGILFWVLFNVFVIIMLGIDILVFHRKSHEITIREAVLWTVFWIVLSLGFNVIVYFEWGQQKALEFLTGYLIEKSLSVDNLFVFLMIFTYFGVETKYQHNTLFWGILGALIMRALFIFMGVALIEKFHWVIYVFGAFLVYIGIKMALPQKEEIDPEKNPVLKLARRFLPVSEEYHGSKFFVRHGKKIIATPLFIVLLAIETTDIVFATDSIPAVLAISHDPFIVYTSNVFAILGLRALFFAVSGMMRIFHLLNYGLAVILTFVGVKMLLSAVFPIPTWIALSVVAGVLVVSIAFSVAFPPKDENKEKG